MRNLPESRHAPVNSVFSQIDRLDAVQPRLGEYAPHGALLCRRRAMGSNDLPPYAPSPPMANRTPSHRSHLRRRHRFRGHVRALPPLPRPARRPSGRRGRTPADRWGPRSARASAPGSERAAPAWARRAAASAPEWACPVAARSSGPATAAAAAVPAVARAPAPASAVPATGAARAAARFLVAAAGRLRLRRARGRTDARHDRALRGRALPDGEPLGTGVSCPTRSRPARPRPAGRSRSRRPRPGAPCRLRTRPPRPASPGRAGPGLRPVVAHTHTAAQAGAGYDGQRGGDPSHRGGQMAHGGTSRTQRAGTERVALPNSPGPTRTRAPARGKRNPRPRPARSAFRPRSPAAPSLADPATH